MTNVNLVLKLILDERLLQIVSNHPVHILNSEGDFSPSAFIPFCIFGNNMINLGKKISSFELPVCNIFLAKIWNDQLCYEMDLNLLKDEDDLNYQLKNGLTLILDFNEERQFAKDSIQEKTEMEVSHYFYEDEDNGVQVHLDSISIVKYEKFFFLSKLFRFFAIDWRRRL